MDRVRGPPVLLLDQRPLDPGPALAAVLDRVQAAGEAGGDRLALDLRDRLGGKATAEALGLLLQRDQHVLGEAPGPCLEVELVVGER